MKLTCAIVDDEPLAVELLESYVKKTPFLELSGSYPGAIQAMRSLQVSPVQLLFLDIQMPELTGLEFSKMVDSQTRIVFTTAFNQYAIDSYRVNALDYLLKPVTYSDFLQAANKALQWFELVSKRGAVDYNINTLTNILPQPPVVTESPIDSIFVKSEYKLVQIMLNDIQYIEGLKDYLKIYTENNPRPILSLMSMKSMEKLLPHERFMRVHRSFIVNVQKITIIDRNRIVFGKAYIPISDSYKKDFNDFLNKRSI
jgi:two-component system LytT family response regulator